MGKFFIYNANINDARFRDVTIIFNPETNFDILSLQKELTEHFRSCHQTSALVFYHCSLLKDIEMLIESKKESIFRSIPIVEEESLRDNIFFVSYNEDKYIATQKFIKKNINEIVNQGLARIFIQNGGLIESNGIAHHYVFPSGKHSSKFLRTANVLVRKSEIDFIALNLLHKFERKDFEYIYCDTLSINVIGYSIESFLSRFLKDSGKAINIESFQSYEGIYHENTSFYENSVFLISASTSGGLINYLKSKHPEIYSKRIHIIYYMPIDNDSPLADENVLCNLKRNEKLRYGIDTYEQYKPNQKCIFCENQSTPIKIKGDSFSLEEPIVNKRNIVAKDYITKELKDFVELFKYNSKCGTVLKVSYSESTISRKDYNLYIDYERVIDNVSKGFYSKHKKKLDAYINQFIPSSIKYIIHLNDKGSESLAGYISKKLKQDSNLVVSLINQSNLGESEIPKNISGAILIVGSCITNGKNLLYLSRYFRNFENIRLVYFVGVNRISNTDKYKELKSNLKYGLYGPENSSFVEIEKLPCDNSNTITPWQEELEFLKEIREDLDDSNEFLESRIDLINGYAGDDVRGGCANIFYSDFNNNELKIRKNSAFFNDNKYFGKVKQSDIYFTISCVLNNMRNNEKNGLFQTNFVRNILDPFVFNRFNDGVIQASILRSANSNELNYSISKTASDDMLMLLRTFIRHRNEYQGEALIEFLFALSIGKLKLEKVHYKVLLDDLSLIDDPRIELFKKGIQKVYNNTL